MENMVIGGVYVKCITNSLLPLHKSIHCCMIVKDSGKGQVTRTGEIDQNHMMIY